MYAAPVTMPSSRTTPVSQGAHSRREFQEGLYPLDRLLQCEMFAVPYDTEIPAATQAVKSQGPRDFEDELGQQKLDCVFLRLQ